METLMRKSVTLACVTVMLIALVAQHSKAAESGQEDTEHFTYEFYYKIKWGYFEEWMELYKKNHYPILKRLQEMGHIVQMEVAFPIDHPGEADRWDVRFTIVYPNVKAAFSQDSFGIVKELFPDQDTFKKEEKRRFELLLEHKDIPIRKGNIKDW